MQLKFDRVIFQYYTDIKKCSIAQKAVRAFHLDFQQFPIIVFFQWNYLIKSSFSTTFKYLYSHSYKRISKLFDQKVSHRQFKLSFLSLFAIENSSTFAIVLNHKTFRCLFHFFFVLVFQIGEIDTKALYACC